MEYKTQEIKKGIKLHFIETDIFKTNLIAIFLTIPLNKETVTINTLLPAVLRRGTAKLKTQEEISKVLENMYGASFDCGVEKTGDNHITKFYIESLENRYTLNNEDLVKETIENLLDIIFNPLIQNEEFNLEYVKEEKENVKNIIESKIDKKDQYALDRCIEEMYKNKPYGLYKYGYIEQLEKITAKDLYNYYKEFIATAKVDIFISGNIEEKNIIEIVKENKNIKNLDERETKHIINTEETEKKEFLETEEYVEEKLDISQGKLVLGLDVHENAKDSRYIAAIYNAILGGTANSKLFQNVREKASLAYTVGSVYLKQKNNIFIKAGIEIENFDKAVDIIKLQIKEMEQGKFTQEEIEEAKRYMLYGIKAIEDEQDTGIIYYMGQELVGFNVMPKEYIEKINRVTKEQIIAFAKTVKLNTVYFLRN